MATKMPKIFSFFFFEDYAQYLKIIVSNEAHDIAKLVDFTFLSIFEHIFIHGNSRPVDITLSTKVQYWGTLWPN